MEILIPELLPAPLQEVLRSFVRRLKEQLGEHLLSVLLYGGAAKNHFRAGLSDVNLLLVLDRVTLDRLDAIAGAVARGAGVARLRVMTLGETDLADSAEVFSTKFQDIQRHHKVLWGADPTRRMSISRERLERQAKREMMNLHLRLRQGYVESHARPEVLEQILKRSVTAFLLNLGVILEIKTGVVSEDLGDVVRLAAGHGFSESQLRSFLELKLGKIPRGIPRDLYKAFAANVEIALGLFS